MFCCFFFKQKTAYEMRISDWSSDVCSSDLLSCQPALTSCRVGFHHCERHHHCVQSVQVDPRCVRLGRDLARTDRYAGWQPACNASAHRSEEHTSELQSLMRISYSVFCLKKQKTNSTTPHPKNYLDSHRSD